MAYSAPDNARTDIEPRDVDFGMNAELPRHWLQGDPWLSHFFNGLSVMFPEGERFFMESVRRYREQITDPALRRQVDAFIAQELNHGREHRAYNEALDAQGLNTDKLERQVLFHLNGARRLTSKRYQLAVTCALEHFTAIMAHVALSDPAVFDRDGLHPRYRSLWMWHAVEETEHKAVAYDVYTAIGGGYLRRVLAMAMTTMIFGYRMLKHHLYLLHRDGELWSARGFARAFRYLWIRPGFLRQATRHYFAYYRPGFHPWDQDNRALITRWEAEYAGLEKGGAQAPA